MTYLELLDLIKSYGDKHVKIKSVIHGDYEDIVDLTTRNAVNYPALWIETPEMVMVGDSDSISQAWDVAIVVLESSDPKDKARTRAALNNTLLIARQIMLRMAIENGVQNIKSILVQQIHTLGNDYDQGWRVSNMLIPAQIDETCRDSTVWSDFV